MLVRCRADLHVHTLLSPCAELEMIPPLIVRSAEEAGLDLIAVTDHNSTENSRAVIEAAKGSSVRVLPGLECESLEGVHVLCIFDEPDDAESMQDLVYSALPDLKNSPEKFGEQMVVTAEAEFVRYNERLLLASTSLPIEQIVEAAGKRSGLAIPAHIDRRAYGLYGVLGLMPRGLRVPAVEISKNTSAEAERSKHPELEGTAMITSSDAHVLADIGAASTVFLLEHRTVSELIMALGSQSGREVM